MRFVMIKALACQPMKPCFAVIATRKIRPSNQNELGGRRAVSATAIRSYCLSDPFPSEIPGVRQEYMEIACEPGPRKAALIRLSKWEDCRLGNSNSFDPHTNLAPEVLK